MGIKRPKAGPAGHRRLQGSDGETADPGRKGLYTAGGAAALIAGAIFLMAIVQLIAASPQPGAPNGRPAWFQDNWLIVLFKLNAGFSGVQAGRLHGLNFLDIAIMALAGITVLGLYAALKRSSRIGSAVALIQPFLGIALFVATKTAGRSSVMGAGLVISIVMLRSRLFGRATAFAGILAGVLLLAGDFGTNVDSPSSLLAVLIAIGYVLLMAWFLLVGQRLMRVGRLEGRTLTSDGTASRN